MSGKGESVKTELETAEVLNKFFSNIVNNLEISKYYKCEFFIGNIEDQTPRAILRYRNHPSIIAIKNKFKSEDVFYFRELEKKETQKEILKLNNNSNNNNNNNSNNNKASQRSDIPTKNIKGNSD